jgi:hypothetical protein
VGGLSVSDSVTEQLAESALLKLISRWFIVLMGGAVAWMVALLIEIDKRDSVQSQRIDHIAEQIDGIYEEIDDRTKERYTSSDARVDKANQAVTDNIQNTAIERILQRIDDIDASTHDHKWPEHYDPR